MIDPQALFERFLASLNDFPKSNLEVHATLLSTLSGSRLFKMCNKMQAKIHSSEVKIIFEEF